MNSHTPLTLSRHSDFLADFPIQSLWIGSLGLLERLSMASFIQNGHAYHLYTYDLTQSVPRGVVVKDAREILPEKDIFTYPNGKEKGGYSGFADWFRYELLAKKGGWWCDTDVICLKPFHFESELVLAHERTRLGGKKICVGVIFAAASHPLISACAENARNNNRLSLSFAQNGEPIMRKYVKMQNLARFIQPPEIFNPVNWWRSKTIIVPQSATILPPQSVALHCFAESWRWRLKAHYEQLFHNQHFPHDTLLGSLQHRYAEALHA